MKKLRYEDNIYLIGFSKSEKYFFDHREKIVKKIFHNKFNKTKPKIKNNSVMIGIRMYEDVPYQDLKKFGGLENFKFYNDLKLFKNKK